MNNRPFGVLPCGPAVDADLLTNAAGASVQVLTYRSPDGEEGYPGSIDIAVTYTLTAANALVVETEAWASQVTPLSLAHHSHFNLAGEGAGSVADHLTQIKLPR
jgi:aldose 1-epimerase